ncbi:alpha/beta fold hydrolase [Pyxidicoccus sp. 3LG]
MRRLLLSLPLLLACSSARQAAPATDAGRLDCSGTGEPAVVFIPGASRGASDWDAVRGALKPGVKACAWDPPGSGPRTSGSDARLLLDALAGQAKRWVLVGHSYGGLVVRVVAASAPDRLAAVLFVDSVHEDGFDPAQAYPVTEKQHIDWVPSFREAARAGLPREVPVLALSADYRDQPSWEQHLGSQRKLVAGGKPGEVVVVEWTGHHIPRDRPTAVAEAVQRLLEMPAVH